MSDDQLQNRIEKDLILLGGSKNNKITRRLINKFRTSSIVDQTATAIYWMQSQDQKKFTPKIRDKDVISDYGLIVRMKNPFTSYNSTICLFSGEHTYGTIAAAKYFTENLYKEARWKDVGRNIVAIVSCDVVDGHPVNLRLEKKYIFKD